MTPALVKYNPAFLDDEQLIRTFVVRQELLEFILEVIRENSERPAEPPQHVLIVGPRGSGKTTLVRRVAAEIRTHAEVYRDWYPVVLSEENYQVSTPGEFWLEVIFHLADQSGEDRWMRTYEDLRRESDETRLRERCLSQLAAFTRERGQRLLLAVENLNALLGEQISSQAAWELRHTLQNEPAIMLLGTATVRFQEIADIDKAWFELLAMRSLDPITLDECEALWESVTERPVGRRPLRAIEILTGGNPRLVKVLASFAARRSFRDLMGELIGLIDNHTEYFKSLLDGLPAKERKVFTALLDAWDPVSARDLAEATRMSASETSALLARLVSRGAVQVKDESPRRKTYEAAERLFNIYYLMRRRGHPSNRVRAVVDFMVRVYEPESLSEMARLLSAEVRGAPDEMQRDYIALFEDVHRRADDPRARREFFAGLDPEILRLDGVPEPIRRIREALGFDSPELMMSMPNVKGARGSLVKDAWRRACDALASRGRMELAGAIEALNKALAEGRREYQLLGVLAECKARAGDVDAARELFEEALAAHPKDGWLRAHYAQMTMLGGRPDVAEQLLVEALADDPRYGWAWSRLGLIRIRLRKYAASEAAFRTAISLDQHSAEAWSGLGEALQGQQRLNESEEAYRRSIAIDDTREWPWARLGYLLHKELKQPAEAKEAYHRALAINDNLAFLWALLGKLVHEEFQNPVEAEDAYRRALAIDGNLPWAWALLGELFHVGMKRPVEAEEAYRRAIAIEGDAYIWTRLGRLLTEMGRPAEACEAYRNALAKRPCSGLIWYSLGRLYHYTLEQHAEAREAYEAALSVAEKSETASDIWTDVCVLHLQCGREPEARLARDRAIQEWLKETARGQSSAGSWEFRKVLGNLAAVGYLRDALIAISASDVAPRVEPVIVALRLLLGEKPSIAKEIFEIGKDVAREISVAVEDLRGKGMSVVQLASVESL